MIYFYFRLKVNYCNENEYILSEAGIHTVTNEKVNSYGIPLQIEFLFKEILISDNDITHKRYKLLIKVKINKKENDKKPAEKRVAKYNFDNKIFPNLSQVFHTHNNIFIYS